MKKNNNTNTKDNEVNKISEVTKVIRKLAIKHYSIKIKDIPYSEELFTQFLEPVEADLKRVGVYITTNTLIKLEALYSLSRWLDNFNLFKDGAYYKIDYKNLLKNIVIG